MTLAERIRLVLAFARVLYVNGQSTEEIVAATARLGDVLGLRATIIPRWGELALQAEDGDTGLVSVGEADPTGIDMHRVAATMRAVDELNAGHLTPVAAMDAVARISTAAPASAWVFALADAVAAVSVAVLSGVQHLAAATLIFVSAGAGSLLLILLEEEALVDRTANRPTNELGTYRRSTVIGSFWTHRSKIVIQNLHSAN